MTMFIRPYENEELGRVFPRDGNSRAGRFTPNGRAWRDTHTRNTFGFIFSIFVGPLETKDYVDYITSFVRIVCHRLSIG